MLVVSTSVVKIVLLPQHETMLGAAHLACYVACIAMVGASHLRAMLSNPGRVPLGCQPQGDAPDEEAATADGNGALACEAPRHCDQCQQAKPPGAHHCSVCERCVRGMDHHCPWVNNCVGEANQKFFLAFLWYATLALAYSLALLAWQSLLWGATPRSVRRLSTKPERTSLILCSIATCMLCVFFLMFVLTIACAQYEALVTNTPGIDAMRVKGRPRRGIVDALAAACGERPTYRWLLLPLLGTRWCPLQPHRHRR